MLSIEINIIRQIANLHNSFAEVYHPDYSEWPPKYLSWFEEFVSLPLVALLGIYCHLYCKLRTLKLRGMTSLLISWWVLFGVYVIITACPDDIYFTSVYNFIF
jgi:hypothetical protein